MLGNIFICLPNWNLIELSYQAVFLYDQKLKTKIKYLKNKESF